jgi:signal recognition particle GTPase
MATEIRIEPNYENLFQQFMRDAMLSLSGMSRPGQRMVERRAVYSFVASFRIALGSATSVDQIVELRKQFDEAATQMYAAVQHDDGYELRV